MASLVSCPSCSTYILPGESSCPFCGARQASLRRAAGAVAVGLALTGCPADDDPESETINSAAAYGVEETVSDTDIDPSASQSDTEGSSSSSSGGTEGDTESGSSSSSSGGSGDTEPGSTSVSPDYGVPTTG